jgi:ankyrin repeat protein
MVSRRTLTLGLILAASLFLASAGFARYRLHLNQALMRSILARDLSGVDRALALGADPNATSPTGKTFALHLAAGGGQTRVVQRLLAHGARVNVPNSRGVTPLMCAVCSPAAQGGDHSTVEALISAGAYPNTADPTGRTPLMVAAEAQQGGLAWRLLRWGAKVDQRDRSGRTALMYVASPDAVRRNGGRLSTAPLDVLLGAGADINAQDRRGNTTLTLVVDANEMRMAYLLIESGADLDIRDRSGNTPLMRAVMEDRTHSAQWLLYLGADPRIRSRSGETALTIAARKAAEAKARKAVDHSQRRFLLASLRTYAEYRPGRAWWRSRSRALPTAQRPLIKFTRGTG